MQPLTDTVSSSLRALDPIRVRKNAAFVAEFDGSVPRSSPLRTRFLTALNRLQKGLRCCTDPIKLEIVDGWGLPISEDLLRRFMISGIPVDWKLDSCEATEAGEKISLAIAEIRTHDGGVFEGFDTIIGSIVLARCPGFQGGSTSNLIGAIWLAPTTSWSVTDYAERLVHEYVHNVLFLDEMVNSIFTEWSVDRMAENDAVATSAILKSKRGLDKSYHSAFVSAAIQLYYTALGRPERAAQFTDGLDVTLSELVGRRTLLTPNGNALLDDLLLAPGRIRVATGHTVEAAHA